LPSPSIARIASAAVVASDSAEDLVTLAPNDIVRIGKHAYE
jgi:hypothetical protein